LAQRNGVNEEVLWSEWFVVRVLWSVVRGLWFVVCGPWFLICGSWFDELSIEKGAEEIAQGTEEERRTARVLLDSIRNLVKQNSRGPR
jgi:hypothetical protein